MNLSRTQIQSTHPLLAAAQSEVWPGLAQSASVPAPDTVTLTTITVTDTITVTATMLRAAAVLCLVVGLGSPAGSRRVELDFKTPNLGFLPFSENNDMIWSIYHLFIFYKRISHFNKYQRDLDSVHLYSHYYYRSLCHDGCPIGSFCQWGVCVCKPGKLLDNRYFF